MSDLQRIFDRISTRLNDVLCEMKPDYDDSVTGFNEAWDIMRAVFKDEFERAKLAAGQTGGPTEANPDRPYCKPDQSCCDFCCGN